MKYRAEQIEGKTIQIIDEVLTRDEIEAFHDYAGSLQYSRKEKSLAGDPYPIFSVDFDPGKFEQGTFIGKKARGLFDSNVINPSIFKLYRAYINMSNYGDVEFPHYDCETDKPDITVLYYVNKNWNYCYGGETLFYSGKDTRLAVLPTPGRFLIFPGAIEHAGGVASRICKEPRLSLALKYKLS